MKQFTTPPVRVRFPTIEVSDISRVDFVIKATISRYEPPLVERTWDGEDDKVIVENDAFVFEITEEESSNLPVNDDGTPSIIYLDARVETTGGKILNTPIQKIRVNPTLFSEDYKSSTTTTTTTTASTTTTTTTTSAASTTTTTTTTNTQGD